MWAVVFTGLIEDCKVFDTKEEAINYIDSLEELGYNNTMLVELK
jgi:hypothetical protein